MEGSPGLLQHPARSAVQRRWGGGSGVTKPLHRPPLPPTPGAPLPQAPCASVQIASGQHCAEPSGPRVPAWAARARPGEPGALAVGLGRPFGVPPPRPRGLPLSEGGQQRTPFAGGATPGVVPPLTKPGSGVAPRRRGLGAGTSGPAVWSAPGEPRPWPSARGRRWAVPAAGALHAEVTRRRQRASTWVRVRAPTGTHVNLQLFLVGPVLFPLYSVVFQLALYGIEMSQIT